MTPDILQQIVAEKRREIDELKSAYSLSEIEKKAYQADPVRDFRNRLESNITRGLPAVIAEIKKASPSKGVIRQDFNVEQIARSYAKAGASCLSVLTDSKFFQGSAEYLQNARQSADLPVLRKDFIIDPYQVFESRSLNADCILLIVSILDDDSLKTLSELARDLSMNVLVEVHDADELRRALSIDADILGINNRNLRTFEVSLDTTIDLMHEVPGHTLLVTESGIHSQADVLRMLDKGIFAFLVGEAFMKEIDPGLKLEQLFFSR